MLLSFENEVILFACCLCVPKASRVGEPTHGRVKGREGAQLTSQVKGSIQPASLAVNTTRTLDPSIHTLQRSATQKKVCWASERQRLASLQITPDDNSSSKWSISILSLTPNWDDYTGHAGHHTHTHSLRLPVNSWFLVLQNIPNHSGQPISPALRSWLKAMLITCLTSNSQNRHSLIWHGHGKTIKDVL